MPILKHEKTDIYEWAVWQITEDEQQLLSSIDIFYKTYTVQLERLTAPHRRLEWLAVRTLLNRLLPDTPEIIYNADGKPFLSDSSHYISISHTKGYVAIILSKKYIVGIDIEQYGRKVEKVRSHFMKPTEEASLYKGDYIWSLLLHWSAKETIFKCLNIQKDFDLVEDITIDPFDVHEEGSFIGIENRTESRRVYQISYQLTSEYVMTYTLAN
jgi:phosphopantetheinyl transferase